MPLTRGTLSPTAPSHPWPPLIHGSVSPTAYFHLRLPLIHGSLSLTHKALTHWPLSPSCPHVLISHSYPHSPLSLILLFPCTPLLDTVVRLSSSLLILLPSPSSLILASFPELHSAFLSLSLFFTFISFPFLSLLSHSPGLFLLNPSLPISLLFSVSLHTIMFPFSFSLHHFPSLVSYAMYPSHPSPDLYLPTSWSLPFSQAFLS